MKSVSELMIVMIVNSFTGLGLIYLLGTTGRILERIVQNRLTVYTEGERLLLKRQFRLQKARSTLDVIEIVVFIAREATVETKWTMKYCDIITLDVKNAFSTANYG